MSEIALGLVAFAVLLALWVVLPHRVVRRRRLAAGDAARTDRADQPAARPLSQVWRRPARRTQRGVIGMRLTRPAANAAAHAIDGGPHYVLVIDLAGMNGATEARVPVYRELTRTAHVLLKEQYWTNLAGLRLAAGNLPTLEGIVREALGWLVEGYRLPHYWFRAPGGPRVPVLRRFDAYLARVPGGPDIAGWSLAVVRERLCAYLQRADLAVTALSYHDLQFHGAYAVLEAPGIWVPVFNLLVHVQDSSCRLRSTTTDFTHSARLHAPDADVRADSLLAFRHALAESLVHAGRLRSPDALMLTGLSDQAWTELIGQGAPSEYAFTVPDAGARHRVAVEVLRVDGELAFPLHRLRAATGSDGDRRVLFAASIWDLADAVGRELERRAVVRRDEIRVQRVQ